jgi:hypothetical protein
MDSDQAMPQVAAVFLMLNELRRRVVYFTVILSTACVKASSAGRI